jgi:hypothetical protein
VNDPTRDPPSTKFGGEARAGQTSTSTGGSAGAREGTMSPDYEGTGDGFLGPDAHVVSGEPRTGDLGGDTRGGPAMVIDTGRNPNASAGGDDLARSHGQDDDSVRTAEQSRKTDDQRP